MRLFFAIVPPVEIVKAVEAVQADLRERCGNARLEWTLPEQFHFTVRFLGETNLRQAERALESGQVAVQDRNPFEVEISGAGAFPNITRPSVCWVGAGCGADPFLNLASTLDAALQFRNFPPDKQGAKPHLTLARAKTYDGEAILAKVLRTWAVDVLGTFTIDKLLLMQSRPSKSGTEYIVVRELPFEPPKNVGKE